MLFAHMKRILKMDRLRLRGLSGARDEFLLTATAQNLRRRPQAAVRYTLLRVAWLRLPHLFLILGGYTADHQRRR